MTYIGQTQMDDNGNYTTFWKDNSTGKTIEKQHNVFDF